MASYLASICFACSRFRPWTDGAAPLVNGVPTAYCAAFPEGIPDAIFAGFDHRKPLGGEEKDADGKPILFELDEDDSDAEAKLATYEQIMGTLGNVERDN